MTQWINNHPRIVLSFLILLSFCLADGYHVINFPPLSIHQWRQSDCFAYARNYFTKNDGLFRPSFYNLAVKEGRSISELPVFYYVAAKLFHLFGVHYWVLRGLTFLSYLLGLYYLFACIRFWIKDTLASLFPVILLATTPYFYYYALNFLPNVPAISFSFCGLYYMLLYERKAHIKHLIISTAFFILSVLIKPTDGGLILAAYLCVAGKDILFNKLNFKKFIPVLLSTVIIGILFLSWVKYVNWYNNSNENQLNLLGIYPIWDMTRKEIADTFTLRIAGFWARIYQDMSILYFILILLVVYIIKWKYLDNFLKFFTLFLLLGGLTYSVLWFKAFAILDYYQLINVIPPAFLIITITEYFIRTVSVNPRKSLMITGKFVMIVFIVVSLFHNRDMQHERYFDKGQTDQPKNLFTTEPYLRQIGIAPEDIVISIPDLSPNITLVAFGNPGYTSLFDVDSFTLCHFKNHGAKYLIINDTSYLHNKLYTPYMNKPVGHNDFIYVFDIR